MSENLEHMQAMANTVNLVQNSKHPTNKVATSVYGSNFKSESFTSAHTNTCPHEIQEIIKIKGRIRERSGYIHAELNALMGCKPGWQSLALTVTDPPCPNCMKNIVDAGVTSVFIDAKGFKKDFYQRRRFEFDLISKRIAKFAGISLYVLNRKKNEIHPILLDQEISEVAVDQERWELFPDNLNQQELLKKKGLQKSVTAYVQDLSSKRYLACSSETLPGNMSQEEADALLSDSRLSKRYNFKNFPILSIILLSLRKGFLLDKEIFHLNFEPSSLDLVYIIAFGIEKISLSSGQEMTRAEILRILSS